MNIDFGTAFHKPNGNAVKVTLNEFRDKMYKGIKIDINKYISAQKGKYNSMVRMIVCVPIYKGSSPFIYPKLKI